MFLYSPGKILNLSQESKGINQAFIIGAKPSVCLAYSQWLIKKEKKLVGFITLA